MRLNELLNFHKNNVTKGDGPAFNENKFLWATSNMVLMFLENVIKRYTRRPIFSLDNPITPLSYQPAIDTYKPKLHSFH